MFSYQILRYLSTVSNICSYTRILVNDRKLNIFPSAFSSIIPFKFITAQNFYFAFLIYLIPILSIYLKSIKRKLTLDQGTSNSCIQIFSFLLFKSIAI